jgi:hypothetical protein
LPSASRLVGTDESFTSLERVLAIQGSLHSENAV